MFESWENKKSLSEVLKDLGYIGCIQTIEGHQLLWSFSGDPVAWDASENMEWIIQRLVPGLKHLTELMQQDLLGYGYAFRVVFPNNEKIKPMFSIMVVRNSDEQGTWSIEELTAVNTLEMWMKIDTDMIELLKEFGDHDSL